MLIKRLGGTDERPRSLTLQGLIHEMRIMDANSDYTPVLILISRANEEMTALLDQEDVDELYAFLGHYVTKESR